MIALVGTIVLLVCAGLAVGLTHGAQVGDMGQVGRILEAALVQLPATWVLTGIVVALFGLAPRLVMADWVALVAFLLLVELGPLFQLDLRVMDISPFTHVPKLPGGELAMTPLVWLTAISIMLTTIGLAAFRRRDIG